MSRLVESPKLVVYENAMKGTEANVSRTDDYKSRLAKYIPGEATAGYLALDNLISASEQSTGLLPIIAFAVCLIFAPLYIWMIGRKSNNPTWAQQALIAAVAFAVWAFAIKGSVFVGDGVFAKLGLGHEPTLAGAMLIVFSMGIALYEPQPTN